MKASVALSVSLLIILALSATAAINRWTYNTPFSKILQIVADGTGGCGVLGADTNGHHFIVRIDKKGIALYEKDLGASILCLGIAHVSPKGIAYWTRGAEDVIIHVNKKGVEQTIAKPFSLYQPCTGSYSSTYSDKKGYFSCRVDTQPPFGVKLVRITEK